MFGVKEIGIPKTDSTRAKQQELAYQQRLSAELERLRAQELSNFTTITETLSSEAENEPSLAEKISDATSSSATLAEKARQKDMTRDIEALK